MAVSRKQREYFEKYGVEAIRLDFVSNGQRIIRNAPGVLSANRVAAQEWLAEETISNTHREDSRFWAMLILSVLSVVIPVILVGYA